MSENSGKGMLHQAEVHYQADNFSNVHHLSPSEHQPNISGNNVSSEFQSLASRQNYQPPSLPVQPLQQEPYLFSGVQPAREVFCMSNPPQQSNWNYQYRSEPALNPLYSTCIPQPHPHFLQWGPPPIHPTPPLQYWSWPTAPPMPLQCWPYTPSPPPPQYDPSRVITPNSYFEENSQCLNSDMLYEENSNFVASNSKENESNTRVIPSDSYFEENSQCLNSDMLYEENSTFVASNSKENESNDSSSVTMRPQDEIESQPKPNEKTNNANLLSNDRTESLYVCNDDSANIIFSDEIQSCEKEPSAILDEKTNVRTSSKDNTHFQRNGQPELENQDLAVEKNKAGIEERIITKVDSSREIVSKESQISLASLSPAEIGSIWEFQIIKKPGPRAYFRYPEEAGINTFNSKKEKQESKKPIRDLGQKERNVERKPQLSISNYIKHFNTMYSSTLPSNVYNFDKRKQLSYQIWNFYLRYKMDEAQYIFNINAATEIQLLLENFFKNFTFLLTGSLLSGLASNRSDINISVMISTVEDDNRNKTKLAYLRNIEAFLKKNRKVTALQISGTNDIRCMKKLSIPRLNIFSTSETSKLKFNWWRGDPVNITLTVNDEQSLTNTQLNYLYTYCDWRFQPLYCIIMKWFENKKFCEREESVFSSYSISLMVISFLQNAFEPPVLPKIRCADNSLNLTSTSPIDVRNSLKYRWISTNEMSLGELYIGFFKYYGTFDFKNTRISVRSCKHVKKVCRSYFYIEDPFTRQNTVRYCNWESELIRLTTAMNEEREKLYENLSFDLD